MSEPSPFPPIADYAFLSDREATCLVAPTGNVEWMCAPRPDSPSVFSAILDRGAGGFRVGPADVTVPAGQRYVPGTLVLETTWQTKTGWLVVRDALLIGPWYHDAARDAAYRRPPEDHRAEHVLLREIRCVNGHVEIEVVCDPVFDYGRRPAAWTYTGEGYESAEARADGVDLVLRLTGDLRLGFEERRAIAATTLRDGDVRFAALSWTAREAPRTAEEATERLEGTVDYWREWLNHGLFPNHPWRVFLQRSAVTLKGLTYAPSGALLAAPTTSLPEAPGGERNWDYRYTWIRDGTLALWALYTLGFDREADAFFDFVADQVEAGDGLQVMYGVGGERALVETTLDHLSGYEGARPVRVGNAAYDQQQHDVWGALLDSIWMHTKARERLPERVWPVVVAQVERAIEHWSRPDRGIWEVRGEPRHFTFSKVMCWVALDRGARIAWVHGEEGLAAKWEAVADEIKADVLANGVDRRGVFTQAYDSEALDASVLLLPLLGFLPADDPRVRATVLAIADELTVDGLVLRYRVDQTDDGLGGDEGTFAICSFWLVSALVEIGEVTRARQLCEKLLSFASPHLLYAEELDPHTGGHLGNFPQAFTHLALIDALVRLIRAEEA
jgi:GH15 family glucan-1,4-alpha-glucosidase